MRMAGAVSTSLMSKDPRKRTPKNLGVSLPYRSLPGAEFCPYSMNTLPTICKDTSIVAAMRVYYTGGFTIPSRLN